MRRAIRPERGDLLLATDGGDAGCAGLRWIIDRSGNRPISVTALVVVEPIHVDDDPASEAYREVAVEELTTVRSPLADASGIRLTPRIEWGNARELVDAESSKHELLVVGTHRAVGRRFVRGEACRRRALPSGRRPA